MKTLSWTSLQFLPVAKSPIEAFGSNEGTATFCYLVMDFVCDGSVDCFGAARADDGVK